MVIRDVIINPRENPLRGRMATQNILVNVDWEHPGLPKKRQELNGLRNIKFGLSLLMHPVCGHLLLL